jgi:hypothetical protein
VTVVEDSDLTFARRLEALENAKIAPPSLVETFNALPPPPPLETSGWKAEKRKHDERKAAETLAAALAEQRRLAEERHLADEEADRIWLANVPRRQAALDALPQVEVEFELISGEYDEAWRRLIDLRRQAAE